MHPQAIQLVTTQLALYSFPMKTITVMRHAKSSWNHPSQTDHERPLNDRGRHDAPMMSQRLAERGYQPDGILVSTSQRTRETLDLMLPALQCDPANALFSDAIYEAPLSALLDTICATSDTVSHLLLIGHNPGVSLLCNALVPGSVQDMPTSAVTHYDVDGTNWSNFSQAGFQLVFHDFPKNQPATK